MTPEEMQEILHIWAAMRGRNVSIQVVPQAIMLQLQPFLHAQEHIAYAKLIVFFLRNAETMMGLLVQTLQKQEPDAPSV